MSDLPRPTETPAFFGAPETPASFGATETPLQYSEPAAAPVVEPPRPDYPGYNPQGDGWRDGYEPPTYLDGLAEARSFGHSWEEIHNFEGRSQAAAYEAGYTQEEIDAHLGYRDPQPFEHRAETAWNFAVPTDDQFLSGLSAPEPRVDLSLSPTFRQDYSRALLDQEVRDPRDFAYAYAGAAMRAADADFDDVRLRIAAGFGAEEAARGLPTPEELTDAAVALAPEGALDLTRRKLMEAWERTGEPVINHAKRVLADPAAAREFGLDLADATLAVVQKPFDILADFGAGMWWSREDLREKLKDADLAEQFSTVMGRVVSPRMFWEMFSHNGEMVMRAAKGEPIGVDEAIFAAAAMAHISRFPGGAGPLKPEILPPLPRAELPPGPRMPGEGPVIEGTFTDITLGGVQVKLPPLPDVPLIDFDAPIGSPPRMITAREALIDPPPKSTQVLLDAAERMETLRLENTGARPNQLEAGGFFQRIAAQMADDIVRTDTGRVVDPVVAYHASPFDFSKFDIGAVGKFGGEGFQGEGHGLYFTEGLSAHEFYKKQFTTTAPAGFDPARLSVEGRRVLQEENGGDVRAYFEDLVEIDRELQQQGLDPVEAMSKEGVADLAYIGSLDWANVQRTPAQAYTVKLHLDPALVVDRDASVFSQPPKVKAALIELNELAHGPPRDDYVLSQIGPDDANAGHIIDAASFGTKLTKAEVTDFLASKGIQGSKYLGNEGKGPHHNYVVFDDGKIEMLEKNGTPIKPAEVQKRVEEMEKGMADARTVREFFGDMFGVLGDETGAMPNIFGGDPAKRAARRQRDKEYLDTRSLIMREQSRGGRQELYVDAALAPLAKYVNPLLPIAEAEAAKGPMGDLMGTEWGALMNFIEGVGYGPVLRRDHPTTPVAEEIRSLNAWKYNLMQQMHAEGIVDVPGYRDNYFRHMWRNPTAATTFFNNYMDQGAPGVGKQGSSATFKQRTIPTIADGVRAGLVPVELDPLKLTIYDIGSTVRMYRAGRIRKEMEHVLKDANGEGLLRWRSQRVGDEIALTGVGVERSQKPVALRRAEAAAAPFDARIAKLEADVQTLVNRQASSGAISYARQLLADERNNRRATLKPLQEAVAAATEAAAPGAYLEHAYAPPHVARLYNTWLSNGWGANPKTESLKNQIMFMKNRLVGLQLMAPLFHTGVILATTATTAIQETMARVAGAARDVRAGDYGAAAKDIGKAALAATILPNTVKVYRRGLKARDDYVKLVNDPILNQLVDAGLRIGKRQVPYQMSSAHDYVTSIFQNNAGNTTIEKATSVAKAAGHDLMRQLKAVGGPGGEPLLWNTENSKFGRPGKIPLTPLRAIKMPLDLMAQALTTISAPLFDHLVPVMKAGAAMQMFETWLETHQGASPEVVQRRAQQAVMDAEFRYGEQNLDNIFVQKWAKDTAQMATISATWALSAWAWFAGATGIRGEWNPFNTQSLVAALVVFHGLNGVMTTVKTGELPNSYLDFINYRTGGTLPSGAPERGMMPTEFKELYDMGKIAATALARKDLMYPIEGFADYVLGKGNLILGGALTMATGTDAIGRKPAYMPGGWGGWFTSQVAPIVLEGILHPKKGTGLSMFERTMVRQAPEWIMDPDTFWGKQQGLTHKWGREGIRRAVRDNMKLETPKDLELPNFAAPSRSRSSVPSRSRSSGPKSPSWGR